MGYLKIKTIILFLLLLPFNLVNAESTEDMLDQLNSIRASIAKGAEFSVEESNKIKILQQQIAENIQTIRKLKKQKRQNDLENSLLKGFNTYKDRLVKMAKDLRKITNTQTLFQLNIPLDPKVLENQSLKTFEETFVKTYSEVMRVKNNAFHLGTLARNQKSRVDNIEQNMLSLLAKFSAPSLGLKNLIAKLRSQLPSFTDYKNSLDQIIKTSEEVTDDVYKALDLYNQYHVQAIIRSNQTHVVAILDRLDSFSRVEDVKIAFYRYISAIKNFMGYLSYYKAKNMLDDAHRFKSQLMTISRPIVGIDPEQVKRLEIEEQSFDYKIKRLKRRLYEVPEKEWLHYKLSWLKRRVLFIEQRKERLTPKLQEDFEQAKQNLNFFEILRKRTRFVPVLQIPLYKAEELLVSTLDKIGRY